MSPNENNDPSALPEEQVQRVEQRAPEDNASEETQPQAEAEAPLDVEHVPDPSKPEKRAARIPLTGSPRFVTSELPTEYVENPQVTSGPKENPNVEVTSDFNLVPPSPFVVQEGIGIPATTHMFFLPEQGDELDQRMLALSRQTSLETPQGQAWISSLMVANAITAQLGMTQTPALHRDGSQWRQALKTESGTFGFTAPSYGEEKIPLVDGVRARIRVRALMGQGGVITIPLVRSGFCITLYAPSESALYELYRRFNDEKISYGRSTSGMIFSNEQVYMNSWLLEFCLDHVYDSTVKYADTSELRKLIDALDMPILFAGMARLMYPRGFNYVRSVGTAEGIEHTQMVQGKLDIAKLLWIDNNYLSAKQRTHMSNRTRSVYTAENLKEYQSEFVLSQGREVKLTDNISIILKAPCADDYISDGDRWIEGLVSMVDEAFTTTRPTEAERNAVINRHASMAQMMRYASFVHAVRFDGADHTHAEAIENSLRVLSEEKSFVEIFDRELKQFIADSTASMIAIPVVTGEDLTGNHPRFPNLIPLDVVTVFFTLLAQKLQR